MNRFHSNRATRNLDANRVLFMAFNSDSEFSTLEKRRNFVPRWPKLETGISIPAGL